MVTLLTHMFMVFFHNETLTHVVDSVRCIHRVRLGTGSVDVVKLMCDGEDRKNHDGKFCILRPKGALGLMSPLYDRCHVVVVENGLLGSWVQTFGLVLWSSQSRGDTKKVVVRAVGCASNI
jgi:hypothetical protein